MTSMKSYIDTKMDNINNFKCDVCDISKIARKHHPSVDTDQSSEILELLHLDLCGLVKPESFGDEKYFMVIVDDEILTKIVRKSFLKCCIINAMDGWENLFSDLDESTFESMESESKDVYNVDGEDKPDYQLTEFYDY